MSIQDYPISHITPLTNEPSRDAPTSRTQRRLSIASIDTGQLFDSTTFRYSSTKLCSALFASLLKSKLTESLSPPKKVTKSSMVPILTLSLRCKRSKILWVKVGHGS